MLKYKIESKYSINKIARKQLHCLGDQKPGEYEQVICSSKRAVQWYNFVNKTTLTPNPQVYQ